MFKRRKLLKRLQSLGSNVLVSYRVIINHEISQDLSSMEEVKSFLSSYRDNNVIYSLELYRIEIYSL